MLSSLYIGASGMKTHSKGMGVLGNNLANVNTVGFKSSMATYATLMSQTLANTDNNVGLSQKGMGSTVNDIKIDFNQGSLETTNTESDLSISGKGFFGVALEGVTHYTRAGNFRTDNQGYLVDPHGYRLQGTALTDNGAASTALVDIRLEPNADGQVLMDPAATNLVTLSGNLGATDSLSDSQDPFFAMFKAWDGASATPLSTSEYSNYASVRVYDAEGTSHEATIHYDKVEVSNAGGHSYYEYVVGMNPASDARAGFQGTEAAGLLMAGTLQFNSHGQLIGVSGFTNENGGANPKDLNSWTPAAFTEDGYLQFNMTTGGGATTMGLNFGLANESGVWANSPDSAADVGTLASQLPGFDGDRDARAMTNYQGSSSTLVATQDGYAEGALYNFTFGVDGTLQGSFSNGQSEDLYQVNLFTFINDYGLKAEGGNHYSATTDSGAALQGAPGEGNRGSIQGSTLEMSNVDMAREFVNMIMNQRGFQANGKIITTSDTLLQSALNMKR
jgi:flagellar hook protein FlgE